MHKDFAREFFYKAKHSPTGEKSDAWIMKMLSLDEFVDFAKDLGDEKIASICETMQQSYGYRQISSKVRKRITDKQKSAVGNFLLEKYQSAIGVIAAVYNINESEVMLTPEEIYHL